MAKANTARVARIVAAGEAFCGEGWQAGLGSVTSTPQI